VLPIVVDIGGAVVVLGDPSPEASNVIGDPGGGVIVVLPDPESS
jgi:hypothetical protein